jgi:uncharacterized membrane protein
LTRSTLIVALFFLAIAAALSNVLPLWLDEILQLLATTPTSFSTVIDTLSHNAGSAPLGYLTQHGLFRIFGFSVQLARFPSAVFMSGAVLFTALLGADLRLKKPWLAGAIFAVLPVTLRYGAESRVYAQALFFSVLASFLYVRMSRRSGWLLPLGYFAALLAAEYTLPFAVLVGPGHVLWSVLTGDRKTAIKGAAALTAALAAFIPWYAWAKPRWSAGILFTGAHFSFSARTPLTIFREFTGGGYWPAGLLLAMCAMALFYRLPTSRSTAFILLGCAVPAICALGGDYLFDYFVAGRQFLWVLPVVAVLTAASVETAPRFAGSAIVLLLLICLYKDYRYFSSPVNEDWGAAARLLIREQSRGACIEISPADEAPIYQFFEPGLRTGFCDGARVFLAVTPYCSRDEREKSADALRSRNYRQETEVTVGRSEIVLYAR